MRLELGISSQDFLLMIGACVIQNDMADHNQQFLSPAGKPACEGALACHIDQPFANPLPELLLSGPKLIIVCANYSRRLFCFRHKTP